VRVVVAPDKFRGTVTAIEAAAALAEGARDAGWTPVTAPLADGGEGTLEVLGGGNRTSTVAGPLGAGVDAAWRLDGDRAVVEMSRASGLQLAGGRQRNDPMRATSRGTGELIAEAIRAGAREVLVGVGGSACTDGGLGAVEVLRDLAPLDGGRGYAVRVAYDVATRFLDAPRLFGPQKGAAPAQVRTLEDRLRTLADDYRAEFGVDVRDLPGSGAAGGLGGGLAAIGAALEPGFGLIAGAVGLRSLLAGADLVLTGEGRLDAQSFDGKVVGGVAAMAAEAGVPWCAVVGTAVEHPPDAPVLDLIATFGREAALTRTAACLRRAAREVLSPPAR
jgi:glycerate 2-kinase